MNQTENPLNWRVIKDINDFNLQDIKKGIVFIFAAWSGPSRIAFNNLTHLLTSFDLSSVDVFVLDNDFDLSGELWIRMFGHVFHGAGETLWIRNGKVVAEASAFNPDSKSKILDNTRNLLNHID